MICLQLQQKPWTPGYSEFVQSLHYYKVKEVSTSWKSRSLFLSTYATEAVT